MRIKRLELCGFKSFVDPTLLEFSTGISGIVGPNGCGKSNLVDALRWVLGEQSAKRLRGEAMEDVIFNGTESGRGPSGMAEVSLVLDNEEPARGDEVSDLVRQLSTFAEIQITRRYFRSGESEYSINNRPCRLKDVTELFLGTGVGTKAYAMIEQGRVDQLVNAKPEDIRLFIEEAAGTTLYRDRRLVAERKMERTRDNLARVTDILQELDRSIALYRRVAKKAEQYRQCQQELQTVELQLARRNFDRFGREIAELERGRSSAREREAALSNEISRLERQRETTRAELSAAEADLARGQQALFDVRTARERSAARLEMLAREQAETKEQLERLTRDREQTAARLAELGQETARREQVIAELKTRNLDGAERLAASLASAAEEEARVAALAEEVEKAKTENVECQRREAELRNRVRAEEERSQERRKRREQLAREIAAAAEEEAALVAAGDRLSGDRARRDETITAAREELRQLGETIQRLRSEKAVVEQSSLAAARTLAEARSRLEAAEEVERGYGRYQEGVRAVMQKHAAAPNGILNLVAEVIDTPPEFEKAVAAVLGERLQYVIVRHPADAREAVQELKLAGSGRSHFVPLSPRRPRVAADAPSAAAPREGLTRLLDVVRVEEGYAPLAESLLGDAVLVADLERGLELWRQNGRWRTLVTLDGEVVYPDGVVGGGSSGPYEERLLAQRREIRRLRSEVESLRREVGELEQRRTGQTSELAAVERRAAGLEESLRALIIEQVGVEKDCEQTAEGLRRAGATLARARGEDRALEAELLEMARETRDAEQAIAAAAAERSRAEERRRQAEADLATRRQAVEATSETATELKVTLAQAREKEEALRQGLEQMSRQRAELEVRLQEIRAEAETMSQRAASRADERRALTDSLAESGDAEAARQAELERERKGAAQLRDSIEGFEQALSQARGAYEQAREQRAEADLGLANRTMRNDHLVADIRDRYQVEVGDVALQEGEEAVLEARFQELRQKIARMDRSTVGLEAMGELAEMEERREFLSKQKADLESSIADLQKTISNLNRASRDRFAETFAAVNEKFQEVFPRLFRGGRARLVFTDEADLLGTGVDIQVQPPGMNLRSLSLLSGGQKALTAVSLIFSLFLCRPSPFCVLDEVDAPLDDANIDRFNQMVIEMGSNSQFLIITHNQRTMEVADRLYGVTMEEPGVSKVVSVRLQSAA